MRRDDDIETLPRIEQRLATLQPFRSIQEGTVPDAKSLFRLIGGEDRSAGGEQTAHIAREGGSSIMKHV